MLILTTDLASGNMSFDMIMNDLNVDNMRSMHSLFENNYDCESITSICITLVCLVLSIAKLRFNLSY